MDTKRKMTSERSFLCAGSPFSRFLFVMSTGLASVEAQMYPNTPISWGFQKSKNHKPASAGTAYEHILAKYDAFYLGDTTKKIFI